METLPPEMILKIYERMDGITAKQFSMTCKDHKMVYLQNPTLIRQIVNVCILMSVDDILVKIALRNPLRRVKLRIAEAGSSGGLPEETFSFTRLLEGESDSISIASTDRKAFVRRLLDDITDTYDMDTLKTDGEYRDPPNCQTAAAPFRSKWNVRFVEYKDICFDCSTVHSMLCGNLVQISKSKTLQELSFNPAMITTGLDEKARKEYLKPLKAKRMEREPAKAGPFRRAPRKRELEWEGSEDERGEKQPRGMSKHFI